MLFTGLYYLLFRKETFHRFNRFYLLASLLLAAVIPAVHLPGFSGGNPLLPVRIIKAVIVYAGQVTTDNASGLKSGTLLTLVYGGMALLFTGYLLAQLIHLGLLAFRCENARWNDFRLVILPDKSHSFSFFNFIFLSMPAGETPGQSPVLHHEMAHARQWHSLDILLIQIVKIFQWFNPFVYLAEKALQETHEYLADAAVLEQDGEPGRYRLLLLTQVFGLQPGIFNFFNHSLIKNRLTMMTKEKSPLRNRFKYLAALPLVLLLGLVMCCNRNKTEALPPPPPPPPPPPTEELTTTENEPALIEVDEQATFQGGDILKFREWVQKSVVYPEDAIKKGITGKVTLQFAVNSSGKVCDIKILRGVDPMLDNETIRVLESSPDWLPAKKAGSNVKQQFVMPVVFALQ